MKVEEEVKKEICEMYFEKGYPYSKIINHYDGLYSYPIIKHIVDAYIRGE